MVRARATSLGLVAALGFLMMASLAASEGLRRSALSGIANGVCGRPAIRPLNTLSFLLFTLLLAAIFKVLPDKCELHGATYVGDDDNGAALHAGKSLIGWYLGTTAANSGYGAAAP